MITIVFLPSLDFRLPSDACLLPRICGPLPPGHGNTGHSLFVSKVVPMPSSSVCAPNKGVVGRPGFEPGTILS